MKAHCSIIVLGLLAGVGTACRPQPPGSGPAMTADVVALVGGRPVTRAALERELARRGPGAERQAALDALVHFEATLAKARAAGFDRDPETAAAIERLLVARFEERELAAAETPAVSDEEIRARYAATAAQHAVPAAARGGVLFLKVSPKAAPGQRAQVAKLAEQLREAAAAADNDAFADLVRNRSDDQTTRYQAGDTGWISAGQSGSWEPAVAEALLALRRAGECAPVVETPRGFHVVRLRETRPAGTRPLGEVAAALRHQLMLEKRAALTADFRARMRAGLDIRTNQAALEQILVTTRADSRPPAVP